jgi:hypothetical protein
MQSHRFWRRPLPVSAVFFRSVRRKSTARLRPACFSNSVGARFAPLSFGYVGLLTKSKVACHAAFSSAAYRGSIWPLSLRWPPLFCQTLLGKAHVHRSWPTPNYAFKRTAGRGFDVS